MELLNTANTARNLFPALKNKTYLNFGGQGVMAAETLDTIADTYRFIQENGPFSTAMFKWLGEEVAATRQALSDNFGGQPDNYVLTASATEGCNIVLWGMEWTPGHRLLTTDCEHTGVEGALANLSNRRGVLIDKVSVNQASDAEIVRSLKAALHPDTRLVVISHVLWNTGRVLPVAEIQKVCRQEGIWLLVDGAQSAGVLPIDLGPAGLDCDFYAITGHKWLGGPEGLGTLFVKSELVQLLEPTFVGWRGNMLATNEHKTVDSFEVATTAFPLLSGLRKALAVHNRIGSAQERHKLIMANVSYLRGLLQSKPHLTILTAPKSKAGLLSLSLNGADHAQIAANLESKHILLRTISKPDCLRASVHYLNDRSDLETLANSL